VHRARRAGGLAPNLTPAWRRAAVALAAFLSAPNDDAFFTAFKNLARFSVSAGRLEPHLYATSTLVVRGRPVANGFLKDPCVGTVVRSDLLVLDPSAAVRGITIICPNKDCSHTLGPDSWSQAAATVLGLDENMAVRLRRCAALGPH